MKTDAPQLIVSLDYEVFGDGSGVLEPCVINPATRVLKLAERFGAPVTLFVDAACFSVMDGAGQDVSLIKQQLRGAVVRGHDVQLHLHPQWSESSQCVGGKWNLDLDRWRIGDLDDADIYQQIVAGCRWLEELMAEVKPDYHCSAFRAGGWCIQPSQKVFEILAECGFTIDSSVAPGLHNSTSGQWFDFRRAPEKAVWWLQEDVCKAVEKYRGKLLEVPITTADIGKSHHFKALFAMRQRVNGGLAPECCGSYDGPAGKVQTWLGKTSKLGNLGRVMLDFSTLPADILITSCKQWLKKHKKSNPDLSPLVAIGHTKNFSEASENQLNKFLDWTLEEGFTYTTYPEWLDKASGSLE